MRLFANIPAMRRRARSPAQPSLSEYSAGKPQARIRNDDRDKVPEPRPLRWREAAQAAEPAEPKRSLPRSVGELARPSLTKYSLHAPKPEFRKGHQASSPTQARSDGEMQRKLPRHLSQKRSSREASASSPDHRSPNIASMPPNQNLKRPPSQAPQPRLAQMARSSASCRGI